MPSDDIDRISELARTRELRVAVVESLTSGGLAHAIGAGDGASTWFAGGIVAYMTDVKQHLLKTAPGVDPCSAECAQQLAAGGLALFAADVCVATTGVGGPTSEGGHDPGTVYLGWATGGGVGHLRLQIDGEPDAVVAATIAAASRLLRARAEEGKTAGRGVSDPDPRPVSGPKPTAHPKESDHATWSELTTEGSGAL